MDLARQMGNQPSSIKLEKMFADVSNAMKATYDSVKLSSLANAK
jgi:hypothetical protein